jgi:hypothetical protein
LGSGAGVTINWNYVQFVILGRFWKLEKIVSLLFKRLESLAGLSHGFICINSSCIKPLSYHPYGSRMTTFWQKSLFLAAGARQLCKFLRLQGCRNVENWFLNMHIISANLNMHIISAILDVLRQSWDNLKTDSRFLAMTTGLPYKHRAATAGHNQLLLHGSW